MTEIRNLAAPIGIISIVFSFVLTVTGLCGKYSHKPYLSSVHSGIILPLAFIHYGNIILVKGKSFSGQGFLIISNCSAAAYRLMPIRNSTCSRDKFHRQAIWFDLHWPAILNHQLRIALLSINL